MTTRVAIYHKTEYRYDRPVHLSPHVVRLRPAPHCRTPISGYSQRVQPDTHFVHWQQDPFANHVARYVFSGETTALVVEVKLVADIGIINPFDFFLEDNAQRYPFRYEPQLNRDLAPYLEVSERGPKLRQWLVAVQGVGAPLVDFLVDLNQRIQRDVAYVERLQPGLQDCEETLTLGLGSCRDSTWLLIQICRHLGLAARFVSGYLVQLVEADQADPTAGPQRDVTDLHAWVEVYLPGAGWVGCDPTSGLLAGAGHIPLACTPGPASAAPVSGATSPAEVTFAYENTVERMP